MLAVLAQDPDSGLLDYGDADVLHKDQDAIVLEFLGFYRQSDDKEVLKYLVFDSKFTNYQNLSRLNDKSIKFITIRRRGKKIVEEINGLPAQSWKKIRVDRIGNKGRTLKINDSTIYLKGYEGEIRQLAITGHGKIKPALIITNDMELKAEEIVLDPRSPNILGIPKRFMRNYRRVIQKQPSFSANIRKFLKI